MIAVDLPGHGASPPLLPYTLDAIVDALDATLAGVDTPLTLLGWSFGGLVAQRYAARHPARVARLVLVCTTPRFTRAPDWPQGIDAEVARRFGDELAIAYDATVKRFLTLQMMGAPTRGRCWRRCARNWRSAGRPDAARRARHPAHRRRAPRQAPRSRSPRSS